MWRRRASRRTARFDPPGVILAGAHGSRPRVPHPCPHQNGRWRVRSRRTPAWPRWPFPAPNCLAAPVADLAGNRELLLVQLDRAAGLAQSGISEPHVSQRSTLAVPVADRAGNREKLLVQLDRAAGLAQIGISEPHVSQRSTLSITPAEPVGTIHGRLQPGDAVLREQAEPDAVDRSEWVIAAQAGRFVVVLRVLGGPSLSGLDVRPFLVEEPERLLDRRPPSS